MKRQINRYFFMVTLAGLSFTAAFSQRAYTLDECLEQALANNVRLKNAQNNLQMAKEDKANAFTKYFPNISATGGGVLANKGLLEMEMQPGAVMSMADKGLLGGVTATLPLFTGGQIVNGNKLAALQVEVNQLQLRQSENEVRLTTEQYYWQVVSLKEKLHTLSVLEEQLTRLQADVEASVEAGVVNRNDLLQVQLKQNETQSSRINVENALTLSRNLLAQYMGLGIDSVEVTFTMDNRLPEDPTLLYVAPESALGQTNEYHLLQQNVKASQLQKRMAVGKNLPTVAIGGGYAYENLLDRDHDFWVGFATVSIPLTDWWGGSHDIKKHKIAVRNAQNQLDDQSELLIIRMRKNWNDLNDAYKQVGIALKSIEQATENLRLQTDYYTAGTCTMSDLLEAQTLFQQSRDRYVESFAQYEVKKREYLQATGRN